MSRQKKPQFEILFRSRPSDIPQSVRLRSMLKMMLRRFDFRVTSIRELDGGEDADKGVSDNDNEIE